MNRKVLLTAAAVLALSMPAFAEEVAAPADTETAFSQAIKSIKTWFGSDTPEQIEPAAGSTSATAEDILQIPPAPGVQDIEPAAGAMDDDIIQVPPQYNGPQSNVTPRASSFDGNPAMAAFGAPEQSASDLANIATAAGDGTELDRSKMDCDAILKAAESAEEGDVPDTALIEACETPVDATVPAQDPAQPAFELTPAPALPSTQPAAGEPPIGPAAGEPPIGGAVMPGEPQ